MRGGGGGGGGSSHTSFSSIQPLSNLCHVYRNTNADIRLGYNICYIVCGVVIEDGKVLMIQEAKRSCRGQWYLPAGRMEKNESIVVRVCVMCVGVHGRGREELSILVSCPDVHAHRRRTSGGLSYISCHRGVSSVGIIEALIALRMQLSEKFEDKRSFLYYLSCSPTFK